MEHSHPRVTRVTRVTLESVENRGSVKICEGSAKSTVKVKVVQYLLTIVTEAQWLLFKPTWALEGAPKKLP